MAPLVLELPAIQTLVRLTVGGASTSAPNCFAGLPPALKTMSIQSVRIGGGGITSVTLEHVQNSPETGVNQGLDLSGPDLTEVSITGTVDLNGNLRIGSSPKLRSISFGGSVRVRGAPGQAGLFQICNNAALTGLSFGSGVTVEGHVEIAGNPNLPIPNSPPWPITATTRRITPLPTSCQ